MLTLKWCQYWGLTVIKIRGWGGSHDSERVNHATPARAGPTLLRVNVSVTRKRNHFQTQLVYMGLIRKAGVNILTGRLHALPPRACQGPMTRLLSLALTTRVVLVHYWVVFVFLLYCKVICPCQSYVQKIRPLRTEIKFCTEIIQPWA